MPIDRETERCIPIKQARSLFATQPTYETLLRWTKGGVNGVVLESFYEGQSLVTSHEAVARFIENMNREV